MVDDLAERQVNASALAICPLGHAVLPVSLAVARHNQQISMAAERGLVLPSMVTVPPDQEVSG